MATSIGMRRYSESVKKRKERNPRRLHNIATGIAVLSVAAAMIEPRVTTIANTVSLTFIGTAVAALVEMAAERMSNPKNIGAVD